MQPLPQAVSNTEVFTLALPSVSMGIRIERYDEGDVMYLALDPDGAWAASEFPTELVTLDYNAQGGLIGVEVVGSAAKRVSEALLQSLLAGSDSEELKEKLTLAGG